MHLVPCLKFGVYSFNFLTRLQDMELNHNISTGIDSLLLSSQ